MFVACSAILIVLTACGKPKTNNTDYKKPAYETAASDLTIDRSITRPADVYLKTWKQCEFDLEECENDLESCINDIDN